MYALTVGCNILGVKERIRIQISLSKGWLPYDLQYLKTCLWSLIKDIYSPMIMPIRTVEIMGLVFVRFLFLFFVEIQFDQTVDHIQNKQSKIKWQNQVSGSLCTLDT